MSVRVPHAELAAAWDSEPQTAHQEAAVWADWPAHAPMRLVVVVRRIRYWGGYGRESPNQTCATASPLGRADLVKAGGVARSSSRTRYSDVRTDEERGRSAEKDNRCAVALPVH